MINLAQVLAVASPDEFNLSPAVSDLSSISFDVLSTSSQDSFTAHSLFIPLKGERFDGHDFINDAIAHGAKWVAVQADRNIDIAKLNAQGISVISCRDTLRLFGLCSKALRRQQSTIVAAVTGSCGKTTAKEMLASIFSQMVGSEHVLYTQGNFNNDVGVPKTLLRLNSSHRYAVIEQGASHLQDIARTSEFVESHGVLITNVGEAHLEGFLSREGVYRGKSEIICDLFSRYQERSALETGFAGIACVPCDSPWFSHWQADYAAHVLNGTLLSFGESEQATMRVSNISCSKQGVSCHLECTEPCLELNCDVMIPLPGRHNAINAAGAALLARALGANAKAVALGLNQVGTISGRLSMLEYDGVTLIDDAYNASYNAVLAAIDTLSSLSGLRVLVFGDMGELGSSAIALHRGVGEYARGKIDHLLCFGPMSKESAQAMGEAALHFDIQDDLIAKLIALIGSAPESNDHINILVKGSHAMHMDKIVAALKQYLS